MDTGVSKLTVLFEEPFWVGVIEREDGGMYQVCKLTFGAEPKDYEIYDLVLRYWNRLHFGPPVKTGGEDEQHLNPKRMQRQISKQLQNTGIGTKAQKALQLQHEQGKLLHRMISREQRQAEQQRRFELRKIVKKEKHKGH